MPLCRMITCALEPRSTRTPGQRSTVETAPPRTASDSTTSTDRPTGARKQAATSPLWPEPITTTSTREPGAGGGVLTLSCSPGSGQVDAGGGARPGWRTAVSRPGSGSPARGRRSRRRGRAGRPWYRRRAWRGGPPGGGGRPRGRAGACARGRGSGGPGGRAARRPRKRRAATSSPSAGRGRRAPGRATTGRGRRGSRNRNRRAPRRPVPRRRLRRRGNQGVRCAGRRSRSGRRRRRSRIPWPGRRWSAPRACARAATGWAARRSAWRASCRSSRHRPGRRAGADLRRGSGGEAEQLVVGGGEDGVRVPGGGPDLVVAGQFDVDEGADRLGVSDRGHAADRLAGVPADELRRRAAERGDPEEGGDRGLVDAVGAAGEHQQRVATYVEHEAVGARSEGHPELGRGRGGGPGAVGHVAHGSAVPGSAQQSRDLGDPRVLGRGRRGRRHGADPATGLQGVPPWSARETSPDTAVLVLTAGERSGVLDPFEQVFEQRRSSTALRHFPARSGGGERREGAREVGSLS